MEKANTFFWENVNVEVAGKKILNEVNGRVASGQLMALMGPSGSGKTTLLNFLAQRGSPKGAKLQVQLRVTNLTFHPLISSCSPGMLNRRILS